MPRKRGIRNENVTVGLVHEDAEILRKYSVMEKRSFSEIVRMILNDFVAKNLHIDEEGELVNVEVHF